MFDVNDNAKVGFRRVEVLTGPDGVGAGRRERRHRLLLRRSRQAHGYQKWLAAGRSVHSRCLAGVERGEPAFVPIIMESGSRDKTCEVCLTTRGNRDQTAGMVVRAVSGANTVLLSEVLCSSAPRRPRHDQFAGGRARSGGHYEAEFLGFSYGFRPGRSQHDALDAHGYGIKGRYIWWILDADIRSFFDTISRSWLIRFVEHRIGDIRIIRLIQKWLKAGVLEEGRRSDTLEGTPQGAVISPLLANIYLHCVYDLWAHAWRKRRATGDLIVVRYADDTIAGFQHRSDAECFLSDLKERLARFSLTLHPEKTRLLEFGRFAAQRRAKRGEGKPETFDFLGFTHICGTKKNGRGFQVRRKTQRKRRMTKLTAVAEELRSRRHQTIREQGQWLEAVLKGYYAYFAVPTNIASLRAMLHHIKVRWRMAFQQRSQRKRSRMERLADRYLPQPSILHPWPEDRFLVKHSR